MDKIYRVFFLLKWTIFAVFHLCILVALLLLLWIFQVQPHEVKAGIVYVYKNSPLTNVWLVLGFLGVSGGTVLWLYAKAWNRLFAAWSTRFMFKKYGNNP